MEGGELISDALGRVNRILHRSLEGVSNEMLHQMPTPHSNHMAWLAWHLTRVHDDHLAALMGKPQLWNSEGWHAKFGRRADDMRLGQGDSLEEVAAFRVESASLLLAYHDAVCNSSLDYLKTLTPADMDVELNEPQYTPLPTVGVRLVSVVSDNTQHAGQVAYVRGLLEAKRWGPA